MEVYITDLVERQGILEAELVQIVQTMLGQV
jgi:hypothetical protein